MEELKKKNRKTRTRRKKNQNETLNERPRKRNCRPTKGKVIKTFKDI